MSTENVEGFVLSSLDFEEYAVILTIFTYQYGKINLFAPGVRKSTSKNKYATQVFSKSEFEIFKTNRVDKISKLKTGKLVTQYKNIPKDFQTYLYVQAIAEIVEQLSVTELPDIETYNLLEIVFENENNGHHRFATYLFSLFYLMKLAGGKMLLDRCVRCRLQAPWYRRFDYKLNGLICTNCILPQENSQSPTFVDIFFQLGTSSLPEMLKKTYNFIDLIALHNVFVNYYENDLGMYVSVFRHFKGTASLKVPDHLIRDYL